MHLLHVLQHIRSDATGFAQLKGFANLPLSLIRSIVEKCTSFFKGSPTRILHQYSAQKGSLSLNVMLTEYARISTKRWKLVKPFEFRGRGILLLSLNVNIEIYFTHIFTVIVFFFINKMEMRCSVIFFACLCQILRRKEVIPIDLRVFFCCCWQRCRLDIHCDGASLY